MADITKSNVFTDHNPEIDLPEVAEEYLDAWMESADIEQVAVVFGMAAKLHEVLTDEQKAKLSDYERAALERIHEDADDVAISDEVAKGLQV